MNNNVLAPIPARLRAQFKEDSSSVEAILAAATRKGNMCSHWEATQEKEAAGTHFELACWLHYYSGRVGHTANIQDRVDCVRRCFEAGITNPAYKFFTVFGFGEREFDTCFEMGDGDRVRDALEAIARAEKPFGPISGAVLRMGWSPSAPATAARVAEVADLMDVLGGQLEAPDGHALKFDRRYETSWNQGGAGSYLSAFVRPTSPAAGPFLDAEIRVFLDEPRALLYAQRHANATAYGQDVLPSSEACVRADSYAALFALIGERMTPVLDSTLAPEEELEGPRP